MKLVVIVYPTIMDGTVVRWYDSLDAAERGDEMMSASRNRVMVHGDLGESLDRAKELLDLAYQARDRLRRGEDANDLATHRKRVLSGTVEPIEKAALEGVEQR